MGELTWLPLLDTVVCTHSEEAEGAEVAIGIEWQGLVYLLGDGKLEELTQYICMLSHLSPTGSLQPWQATPLRFTVLTYNNKMNGLAKFTDEQYTTINQSTAGRFDLRVFVNCLQVVSKSLVSS